MSRSLVIAYWVLPLLAMLSPAGVGLGDCICPHTPINQQNGQWFHYATVHDANCNYLYATGYVADSPLSDKVCSTTCGASNCFDLSENVEQDFWFTPAPWTYEQTDTPTEFRNYLDYINNDVHVSEYDNDYSFELVGTVELTRDIGPNTFHAVLYKVSKSSQPYTSYLGVEIANAGGSVMRGLPQFNAARTFFSQAGVPTHAQVPGLLTVNLGSSRYATIRLNQASNSGSTFTPSHPPTHTPLTTDLQSSSHPLTRPSPFSLVNPNSNANPGVVQNNANPGVVQGCPVNTCSQVRVYPSSNWCCKPRKSRCRLWR